MFRIFPLKGRMAWVLRSLPVFAVPPAESPSTINNSDSDIKSKIKEVLKNINHYLFVNLVTPNKMNRFSTTKVKIEYHNLIKTFEKFNWKK